jgi:hypothetical protein
MSLGQERLTSLGASLVVLLVTLLTCMSSLLLTCMSSSASALTFDQPPGSPYPTTDPAFSPSGAGFLGGVASGDFNGDGISDVAVTNATGLPAPSAGESVTVLLGSHSGGLTQAPGSPIGIFSGGIISSAGAIAVGDFNRDGKLDLVVVNEINNTISILLGHGKGHFLISGSPIPFAGSGTTEIAVGDFNGDGKQDIALANSDLDVLKGDGSGGFVPTPESPMTLPGYTSALVSGDFNRDGRSDLALASSSEYLTVYLGTSSGNFTVAPGSPIKNTDTAGITAADLTGNGRLDLVTVDSQRAAVDVLLGNGYGDFVPASGSPYPVPTGPGASSSCNGQPESIGVGDFDGDGSPDLAVTNFGCSGSVAVLQGDGHGNFANAIGSPFKSNSNPRGLAVGDFDGNGRPDLAVANPFLGEVTILQNTTGDEFGAQPSGPAPPDPVDGAGVQEYPYHHPRVVPIHGHHRKKALRCPRTAVHIHHGRRATAHVKRCSLRHMSGHHRGSADRRGLRQRHHRT